MKTEVFILYLVVVLLGAGLLLALKRISDLERLAIVQVKYTHALAEVVKIQAQNTGSLIQTVGSQSLAR